ncbi:E3 ubiquitin-protein ligase CIP8-like [Malania oleifera]|uniref:E3 ubiquitin-protein ligase CIP8-like n=1 Tax=Malania oleifera TaxID=397392 RepID=UPI0025AE1806|nr:E3 ubiquitin-protein ligase CIP8-like [Malania oleifera]
MDSSGEEGQGSWLGDSEVGDGSGFGFETPDVRIPALRIEDLRIPRFVSDSDSEDDEDGCDTVDLPRGSTVNGGLFDDLDFLRSWYCLHSGDRRAINEDFERGGVNRRAEDEREALSMVFDGVEELLMVSSEENSGGGSVQLDGNIERELLLAANNLERILVTDHHVEGDSSAAARDDHFGADIYDTIVGLLADDNLSWRGSPPAARSVVDNLPTVVLAEEDLGNNENVVCVVCTDDIPLQEKVKKLPCSHCFHGECILQWLSIRNSCPLCRFELPTDDSEYEQRRNQRASHSDEA